MKPRCFVLACAAATPAVAQIPSVHGLVWGGNVAGGSWYLRDTPSFTGQPCYYFESNPALLGWGGVASTYGGVMCRIGNSGRDGQSGMASATCGWSDSLTITAPGVPTGTPGELSAGIAIMTNLSTGFPSCGWHCRWGGISLAIGPYGEWSNSFYAWHANIFETGLMDDTGWNPAPTIPNAIPATYDFQFGVPFTLGLYGSVGSDATAVGAPDEVNIAWRLTADWGNIAQVTASGVPISNYQIVATSGRDYTQPAGLCIGSCGGPLVVDGPASATACPGGQTTLRVAPVSSQPMAFQWRKNGLLIPDARSAELVLSNSGPSVAGAYDCVVSSGCASLTTPAASVTYCLPNCDCSTAAPALNVLDFSCFLNRFAAGDTLANCDGSTTVPVLNVLDFSCFLNRFAAGCS